MADRIEDRVDRLERVENSELKVLSDRVDTFLLGGRMCPLGLDEYAVTGRLVKTFFLLLG